MELGQSKATGKRVTEGSQINSTTLLATHGPSVVLGSLPAHSLSPATTSALPQLPRNRQGSTYCSSGILSTARSEWG